MVSKSSQQIHRQSMMTRGARRLSPRNTGSITQKSENQISAPVRREYLHNAGRRKNFLEIRKPVSSNRQAAKVSRRNRYRRSARDTDFCGRRWCRGIFGQTGGYGNMVIIEHPDGKTTRYAHADSLSVKEGQKVAAGEMIATVGSTGKATGPHLAFRSPGKRRGRKSFRSFF